MIWKSKMVSCQGELSVYSTYFQNACHCVSIRVGLQVAKKEVFSG